MTRLVIGVFALGLVLMLGVVGDSVLPLFNPTAAISPYNFPFTMGAPAGPTPWSTPSWDVAVHTRNGYQNGGIDAMQAAHGTDCGAPPATHPIASYQDAVFLCNNHVMTAINSGGYGVIYLMPDHMFDWSQGTAILDFPVSTFRTSDRDWIDLWITPFNDNLELPLESWLPDLQGPPRQALHIRMNEFNSGTIITAETYNNFTSSGLSGNWWTTLESLMTPSPKIRTNFELQLSQNHIRFGIPTLPNNGSMWWIDSSINLPFTRGIVQLGHHSYNPGKAAGCGPPTEQAALGLGCGPNTWHWGGLSMSMAVPFTLIRANERVITPGQATTATFRAGAPSGSFLRFNGIGTLALSFDGGRTWQTPATQQESLHALDHFENYWLPIPQGVGSVMFRGQNWYGGPWFVRDISIMSQSANGGVPVQQPPPPATTQPAPSSRPSPTSGGGGSGGGTGPTALVKGGINAEPSIRPTRYAGANPDSWWCVPPNCTQNANPMITINSELGLVHTLGAATLRIEFPWALIETGRGTYDWTRADAIVNAANAHGVQLQPVLVFSPSWAAPTESSAPAAADYQAFVKTIVGRYHNTIHYWELWNEPDLSSYWSSGEAAYVSSIVIPGYAGAKAADPTAKVILAGPSGWNSGWFDGVFANGGGSSFDIVAYHDYGSAPQQTAFTVQTAEANHGGRWPIWLGEYGVQEGSVNDVNQQALMTAVLTSSAPLAMAQWYNLRDDMSLTCCPAQVVKAASWGIVMHDDATLKNGFMTMQALLAGRPLPTNPTPPPAGGGDHPPATAPPTPSSEHPPGTSPSPTASPTSPPSPTQR